jgi:glycosyltransferase involved in cell wall biosynthesis
MLRQRWPSKRVEHIPHGCPTWFPPRKRTRGRVLGAFGFLEEHKGFWDLLDVLRERPDTELLVFSYAKSAELEARWTEAIKGLAVCWIGLYLPADEIAGRLAAEADALVFWYHDVTVLAASSAVRMGLATGVPVLTSPTGWFTDIQEQTFQPANLVEGVDRLLDDTSLRTRLTAAARDYCHDHSWPRIAERHLALWESLERSTA